MAMAPRAAGRVGHVSHAARAAARLARGMNWLETERRASLMRSKRALGPAPSALIWHFGAVFIEMHWSFPYVFPSLDRSHLLYSSRGMR